MPTALHTHLPRLHHIDHDRFESIIGEAVERVSSRWLGFRVFGEIVDLYWRSDHDHLALELEACWNDLRRRIPFPLLCAYELAPGQSAGVDLRLPRHRRLRLNRNPGVTPGDLASARFPGFETGYESYYLRAADPSGGRGFWIRYTVHRRSGQLPTGSLWFTWFDAGAAGPTAVKTTVSDPRTAPGSWIRIGDARLGPGGARGDIEVGEGAGWNLTFTGTEQFAHLPRPWMYAAPLPRTKPVSLHPAARISGTIVLGDRVLPIEGWPGMVGHNWGSEHAERWIWLHGSGFEGDHDGQDTWLDVVLARIRTGPWTTPWSGFGALSLDGRRHRLGGLARARSTRVDEQPTHAAFSLAGSDLHVHGRVAAPASRFVGWLYADPEGGTHDVVHCSIADLELTVERPGRPAASPRTLRAAGVAAYELGMREHDHGIAVQPFPDG